MSHFLRASYSSPIFWRGASACLALSVPPLNAIAPRSLHQFRQVFADSPSEATSRRVRASSSSAPDGAPLRSLDPSPSTSAPATIWTPALKFYQHYGFTALTFHAIVGLVDLGLWWALVLSPVDLVGIAGRIGLLTPFTLVMTRIAETFGPGSFAIAYVLHKATGPIRLLLTVLATPYLVRRAARNTE